MSCTDEQRIWILNKIRENEQILLRKFDDSLGITKESKTKAWQDLFDECQVNKIPFTQGPLSKTENKNGNYLRDQVWGRWRRECMGKQDLCRKTGSGKCPWKAWEVLLMEIIGEESPIVSGLGVLDSGDLVESWSVIDSQDTFASASGLSSSTSNPSHSPLLFPPRTGTSKSRRRVKNPEILVNVLEERKDRLLLEKLELQNQALRLENYKTAIEIHKECRDNGLPFNQECLDMLGLKVKIEKNITSGMDLSQ